MKHRTTKVQQYHPDQSIHYPGDQTLGIILIIEKACIVTLIYVELNPDEYTKGHLKYYIEHVNLIYPLSDQKDL